MSDESRNDRSFNDQISVPSDQLKIDEEKLKLAASHSIQINNRTVNRTLSLDFSSDLCAKDLQLSKKINYFKKFYEKSNQIETFF